MHFIEKLMFFPGNIFRCDTRLLWMFSLYNTTKSRTVKMALEEVSCYLESGSLPQRLEGPDTTPLYEITTLGIGKCLRDLDRKSVV